MPRQFFFLAAGGYNHYAMPSAISRATAPAVLGRTSVTGRYLLLAILFAVAACYQAGQTVDIIHGLKVSIPYFAVQDAGPRVEGVKPGAEAAGLRRGDILIAVNGRPNIGAAVLVQEEVKATPGTELAL